MYLSWLDCFHSLHNIEINDPQVWVENSTSDREGQLVQYKMNDGCGKDKNQRVTVGLEPNVLSDIDLRQTLKPRTHFESICRPFT